MKIIKQEEKKDDSIFEKIKEYFEKTPIEEIRRGWEEAGEKTKNIKSLPITEFMKAQNQAYFNNEKYKQEEINWQNSEEYPKTYKELVDLLYASDTCVNVLEI